MAIVLAFSGGLDTSFCVPYLIETYGEPVYTVTVNTGGITDQDAKELEQKSKSLGAAQHRTIDARADLYRDLLSYLIKGNVLRGGVYPLCVGPERVTQAQKVVEAAKDIGARAIAHGSTGAGNDQVRFDVAARLLANNLDILTPIRTMGLSRLETTAYLKDRGVNVPPKKTTYSINKGLWGTTIGGAETHSTSQSLPDSAYPDTISPFKAPDEPLEIQIGFEKGLPVSLDGKRMDPVSLIEALNTVGAEHGVGRGIHVGDTIMGIKGRIGFEAPAALTLITAHRELEKIILTRWQRYQKDHLGDFYGMLVHEGQYFDPVLRDVETFFDSASEVVSGTVTVRLFKGSISVLGCDSPFSMFNTRFATYGEQNTLWDGRDAQGFARIYGVQAYIAHRARQAAQEA